MTSEVIECAGLHGVHLNKVLSLDAEGECVDVKYYIEYPPSGCACESISWNFFACGHRGSVLVHKILWELRP